jgi:hypothetical protein
MSSCTGGLFSHVVLQWLCYCGHSAVLNHVIHRLGGQLFSPFRIRVDRALYGQSLQSHPFTVYLALDGCRRHTSATECRSNPGCGGEQPHNWLSFVAMLLRQCETLFVVAGVALLLLVLSFFDVAFPDAHLNLSLGDRNSAVVSTHNVRIGMVQMQGDKGVYRNWTAMGPFQLVVRCDVRARYPGGKLAVKGLKFNIDVNGENLFGGIVEALYDGAVHLWYSGHRLLTVQRRRRTIRRVPPLTLPATSRRRNGTILNNLAVHITSVEAGFNAGAVPASLYVLLKELKSINPPFTGVASAAAASSPVHQMGVIVEINRAKLSAKGIVSGQTQLMEIMGARYRRREESQRRYTNKQWEHVLAVEQASVVCRHARTVGGNGNQGGPNRPGYQRTGGNLGWRNPISNVREDVVMQFSADNVRGTARTGLRPSIEVTLRGIYISPGTSFHERAHELRCEVKPGMGAATGSGVALGCDLAELFLPGRQLLPMITM